jgi:hypothetical protein
LIHNGICYQALPAGLLAVPLVKSPFRSLSMAEVRGSTLLSSCFAAAMVAQY